MKVLLTLALLSLLCTSCLGAARGEGFTLNGDGVNIGPSQEARDEIAKGKAALANTLDKLEGEVAIEQGAKSKETQREAMRQLALAGAVTLGLIGIGCAGKLSTPLAAQAVAGLRTVLELRRSRRLEITLEVGPGGYKGHLLAEGYGQEELAVLVQQAPALDAPKVAALQARIGPHGMKALADADEMDSALAKIPS